MNKRTTVSSAAFMQKKTCKISKKYNLSALLLMGTALSISLLSGCGGSDNVNNAVPHVEKSNTSTFNVSSPVAGASVSGTTHILGTAGSKWTVIAVYDSTTGTQLATGKPVGSSYSIAIDTTKLSNGSHILQVQATSATNTHATISIALSVTNKTASIFYGLNGHNNEGGAYDISSPVLQLSQLKDLGAVIYRNEIYNQASVTKLASIAKTMAAGGVTVYPVILSGIDFGSESAAYAAGFQLGQITAKSYSYPYYEVSNELDAQTLAGNVDGVYAQQFDNTRFQKARGLILGMIDGIKSVAPNSKIIMGGGAWLHYVFDQMLATGTQPDGTTGHPIAKWDITAWHWYSDQGDITHACGGTGCHDVLAALQQLGKPIWINEFGVRPSYGTDTQIAGYLVGNLMMSEFLHVSSKYNIQAIQMYQLYDDPTGGEGAYGLLKNDGSTSKPQYNAYKNFVLSHPK